MKFIQISSMILLLSSNAMANLNASITCTVDAYTVEITQNVNENLKRPLVIVQVYKDNMKIYDQFYRLSYYVKKHNLEVLSYEGFRHSDGVIGLDATSSNAGKADIFIEINASNEVVNGASVDCSIERF